MKTIHRTSGGTLAVKPRIASVLHCAGSMRLLLWASARRWKVTVVTVVVLRQAGALAWRLLLSPSPHNSSLEHHNAACIQAWLGTIRMSCVESRDRPLVIVIFSSTFVRCSRLLDGTECLQPHPTFGDIHERPDEQANCLRITQPSVCGSTCIP